jgi:glyoxylase-like metal-dependent hydrolase (beta-lactamase superfamily II)
VQLRSDYRPFKGFSKYLNPQQKKEMRWVAILVVYLLPFKDWHMTQPQVFTIDLNFLGTPGTIAAYLIPHSHGAILVECGPSSTLTALQNGLKSHGFSPADVTDILLTHIHLDHAGAAGWFARQGARIYVHPAGAQHLRSPDKLLSSAARIYGDQMETLWGEFLPVPDEKLSIPQNNDDIEINGLRFHAVDTPGHADHHYVYMLGDLCFSGDVGGIRLFGQHHLRLPMPPPDFHPRKWLISLERMSKLQIQRIAPTHFGIYEDAGWHLKALDKALNEVSEWIETVMPEQPKFESLNEQFIAWSLQRSSSEGVSEEMIAAYEIANPSWMSSTGIHRYWKKFRQDDLIQEN